MAYGIRSEIHTVAWRMVVPDTKITLPEVHKVAALAHLTLSEHEANDLRQDLDAILTYVDTLAELDLEGVQATTHAIPLEMTMRPDEVVQTLTRDEVLANAPEQADGMFRVPRAVEGGN